MWTVNTGAMLEHNDFTGTDVSPRASLNFKPTPNHAFRLGISSALRTPNYLEEKFDQKFIIPTTLALPRPTRLLFQYTANKGNVNPEQIISREIGYIGKFGGLQLDTRIFSDKISDVIRFSDYAVTPPAGTVLLSGGGNTFSGAINSGDAAVEGIEFQASWQITKSTNLLINHAHVNIRETHPNLKNKFVRSMPNNTSNFMLTQRFDNNWDASFLYFLTSKTTQLGDGNDVDLIRKCDIRLARKFNAGRFTGEVSAVVENLFDSQYEEFADYNTLKRRARLNLSLDF